MKDPEEIKKAMRRKRRRKEKKRTDVLSTGCTLLNLACSGNAQGGFVKGKYFYFVGDSSSGKTWLSLTCFAEAALNPNFKNYRLIYDNGEDGALMDFAHYFGQKMADRLEPPAVDEEDAPIYSETAEDFYYNVDDAIQVAKEEDRPFIYVLDSENSLTSGAEQDKFDESKKARRAGKDTAGSYGDGKAKIHSSHLRKLMRPLSDTGSILIIISQTRDNLGIGFEKKTRSGGRALRFYACLEMWTSVIKKLKKTVAGKQRQIGIIARVKTKKNRLTGKEREIDIPIYHSMGIDDVGCNVDWLVDEKHWPKRGNTIQASEFEFKGTRNKLIAYVEENNLETELQNVVQGVWDKIEAACSVERKRRYE